jgi:hypothetical protein
MNVLRSQRDNVHLPDLPLSVKPAQENEYNVMLQSLELEHRDAFRFGKKTTA